MPGSELDKECVIKRGRTCLKEGFSLSDVLNHNKKSIESYDSYDPEKKTNYFDDRVQKLLVYIPVKYPKEYITYENHSYIFDDLICLEDLLKLNFTLTEDDLKYVHENNIYYMFSIGLLTYGQTKKRFNELYDEFNDYISNPKNKDKIKELKLVIDHLNKVKQFINNLKELCKFPVNNRTFGKHTNPACRFKDKGEHFLYRNNHTPINLRYEDINTQK